MKMVCFWIGVFGLAWNASALADSTEFSPEKNTTVKLLAEGETLTLVTDSENGEKTEKISFETEKPMHIVIDDYNFDGHKDFSIWYLDDGMGTFSIHRLFLYTPANKSFKELSPACGDEFINLKVDRVKKTLASTYYDANEPVTCITRPTKIK